MLFTTFPCDVSDSKTMNMKYIPMLLFGIFFSLIVRAQEDEKIITSKIDKVTVFTQGAQVNRKGNISIQKGTWLIVFDEVSQFINQASIQASGTGDYTIMDVQYRYKYPQQESSNSVDQIPAHITKRIEEIQDSLQLCSRIRYQYNQEQNAFTSERNLILNHPLMKGQGKVDSLELLKGSVAYMQSQLVDIARREVELQAKSYKLSKLEADLRARLINLQNYSPTPRNPQINLPKHQIVVTVYAEKPTTGTLSVNYAVTNAGWSPWYDLKATEAGKPIQLTYKGAIYQYTGEDWKDVKLTLSNASPLRSSTKPVLPTWFLTYYQAQIEHKNLELKKPAFYSAQSDDMEELAAPASVEKDANVAAAYTQRIQNFTSVEFEISLPYQIPSDGKSHFVSIANHELKATFEHYVVPKLDNDAFVIANVTDWESLDLLIGNANIYFGNTYVGRTVIDPTVVTDTMKFAMGRDFTVSTKRTRLKSETKSKIIGGNKVYTATYEIEIRNKGKSEIVVNVEDQIPMSTNEKVIVKLEESSGAEHNETNGMLTWKIKLKPGESKKLVFRFEVTYPKEQTIYGL
ncbi:MAG: mucoidy inhibitor MuiA family protein [Bacteroidetes bacterium]|nr:mucoidy inhibitor MuiA family protein [Bacteroidota bacterium]